MIERITQQDFDTLPVRQRPGQDLSPETHAILKLAIGEGFKTPCHWKHYKGACGGASTVHGTAKRHGMVVRTRCYQGTLYVLRIAPKGDDQ